MADYRDRLGEHEDRLLWRFMELRAANRNKGRDHLRRLRRATRPAQPEARPNMRPSSRQLAIGGMIVLLIAVFTVVAEADGASKAQIKRTVCEVFRSHCGDALRVASCETGGTFDPRARGSAGERGLFQIHPIHFAWLKEWRLWQPRYNARIAYRLSRHGTNWSHWACRP